MHSIPSHRRSSLRRSLLSPLLPCLLVMLAASPAASVPTFTQTCFDTTLSHVISVADFDEDGNLDVTLNPGQALGLAFSFNAIVNLYLGNGSGTLTFARQLATAGAYNEIYPTDVDLDGNLDLVAGGNPMSVLRGNGNGTFQATETYPSTSFLVAVGDLNGDSYPDLIIPEDKRVVVRLNLGNGTFGDGTRFNVGDMVRGIITSDINGDGFLDVVTLTQGYTEVAVLLGKGNGKLGHSIETFISPGAPGYDMAAADFNGDGKMDLAVGRNSGGGVDVLLGNGNGTFGAPISYPMAGNTTRVRAADIDGDGNADLVAANYAANNPNPGGNVSILYGNGTGAFTIGSVIPVTFGNGLAVADINEDSRLDIVVDSCVLLNQGPVAAAQALPARHQPAGGSDGAMNPTATFSPNPLREKAAFGFSLPRDGTVSIHLYDIRGRRVHTLLEAAPLSAGPHAVTLDRRAAGLGAGLYLYRIEGDGIRTSGRIMVLGQ